MPQVCKVCVHPQRAAIDAELMRSWERSLRAIAAEYGLSKDAVFRHEARHLPSNGEDPPAGAEPRQVVAVLSHEKEPDEARQESEIAEQEKEQASATVELVEQKKEPIPSPAPQLWTPEQWEEVRRRSAELARLIQIEMEKQRAGSGA
jgi:hypothetical protein